MCRCGDVKLVSKSEKIKWINKEKGKVKGRKAFKIMGVVSVELGGKPFGQGPIRKTTWNNWKHSTRENKMGVLDYDMKGVVLCLKGGPQLGRVKEFRWHCRRPARVATATWELWSKGDQWCSPFVVRKEVTACVVQEEHGHGYAWEWDEFLESVIVWKVWNIFVCLCVIV